MEAKDEIPADVLSTLDAINNKEMKGYSFAGRFICFIAVLVVIGVLSFALYISIAIGASISEGNEASNSISSLIPFISFCSIVISGILIFKK